MRVTSYQNKNFFICNPEKTHWNAIENQYKQSHRFLSINRPSLRDIFFTLIIFHYNLNIYEGFLPWLVDAANFSCGNQSPIHSKFSRSSSLEIIAFWNLAHLGITGKRLHSRKQSVISIYLVKTVFCEKALQNKPNIETKAKKSLKNRTNTKKYTKKFMEYLFSWNNFLKNRNRLTTTVKRLQVDNYSAHLISWGSSQGTFNSHLP